MAWRTRDGQTSDRQLEEATRRGTEPRTGIHVRKSVEQQLKEGEEFRARCERIRNGDFWTD